MQLNRKENTIVLKEMESNIIEEAVLVLKPGIRIKQSELNLKKNDLPSKDKNLIIVEAQKIIDEYISNIQKRQKQKNLRTLKTKYKISKAFNIILIIGISILLLK